jgi:predicted membrane-bound spermidine synthase
MSWGTCYSGSNNIHFDFPALMSDGRLFSSWGSACSVNEQIQKNENIKTNWINQEAMQLITSFGKDFYKSNDSVQVNKVHNPVLYKYYLKGNWDIY